MACEEASKMDARVLQGISVSSGSRLDIADVSVYAVRNTGLNVGFFSQFLPDNPADGNNTECSNTTWCLGKRLFVTQASIHDNHICAALQGVTIIGRNVSVMNNNITVTTKTWTSPAHMFGITMGVSAGFVGSSEVKVFANRIRGGDYSIGCDGSYPLYTTVQLFRNHWSIILKYYPSWAKKYPHGPVNDGVLIFRDNDYVLAQQVLLDMVSAALTLASLTAILTRTGASGYGVGSTRSLSRSVKSKFPNNEVLA